VNSLRPESTGETDIAGAPGVGGLEAIAPQTFTEKPRGLRHRLLCLVGVFPVVNTRKCRLVKATNILLLVLSLLLAGPLPRSVFIE